MNIRNKSKGFSLIELMVVIGIIAVLSAVIMSNYTQAKAKSRDSKRVADIAQIQLILSQFYDRCNAYPKSINLLDMSADGTRALTCPTNPDIRLNNFVNRMPVDPSTQLPYGYYYQPNPMGEYWGDWDWEPLDYQLYTTLETPSSVLRDRAGMDTTSGWTFVAPDGSSSNQVPAMTYPSPDGPTGIDALSNPLIYDVTSRQ